MISRLRLFLSALVGVSLVATPALADPISAVIVSVLATVGVTATVAAVNAFLINAAISAGLSLLAKKKRSGSGAERQASVVTVQVGEVPREYVFGRVATAGSLVDAFNFGGKYGTDWECLVLAVASHELDALEGFWVWDRYYPFSANGMQAGFSNGLDIQFVNATAAGTAPPARFSAAGWSSTDRCAGETLVWFAYSAKLVEERGGRPQVRFVVRGKKLYDPRKDSTVPGGSGSHRWATPSTWEFSENLAIARYNWVRGIFAGDQVGTPQHLWIGRGLTAVEAPPERVFAAANLCDEDVALKAGGTQKRYHGGGVIRADEEFDGVEEMFASAMAGVVVQREGGVEIEAGASKAAVVEITDADLVVGETISFEAFRPDPDRINTVAARYIEPTQLWNETAAPVRRSTVDIGTDGRPREEVLSLGFVTQNAHAQRCAEQRRRLNRMERSAGIVLGPRFAALEEGDWIGWTSERYHGGGRVVYRVERYGRAASWRKTLALREIAASAYAWTAASDEITPGSAPPVEPAAPDPVTLDDVVITAITKNGLPGVRVTYDPAVDPAVTGIRVEIRTLGQAEITPTMTRDLSGVVETTNGVPGGVDIQARILPMAPPHRSVAAVAWTTVSTSALVAGSAGEVDPITPANVTGTPSITIATLIAPDGTQISRLTGAWSAVSGAASYVVELDNGTVVAQLPASSNAISQIVPTGPTYRYRVKALSTTGTLSAAWSAWSANAAASGDTTAPAPITSPYCEAGPRYIALGWTNPADTDLRAVVIYRNTVNNAGTASLLRIVDGTYFTDTTASIGTTYYYWASTVDRTGNEGARTSIGAATARYINVGGGDIRYDDPDLATEYGVAAGYKFQTRFGTALTLSLADSDIEGPWSAIENRPPVSQGAAITEDPACADASAWVIAGSASFVTISDGKISRTAIRGTTGTVQSARPVPIDASKTYLLEGWYRSVGGTTTTYGFMNLEDGSGSVISGDGTYFAYSPSGATIPTTWTYASRVVGAGTAKPIPSNARQARVGYFPNYAGGANQTEVQGLQIVEVVRIGASLYRADGTVATEGDTITNLGTAAALYGAGSGAYANNLAGLNSAEGLKFAGISSGATSDLNLVNLGNVVFSGNTATKSTGSADWTDAGFVSRESYAGGVSISFRRGDMYGSDVIVGISSANTPVRSISGVEYGIHCANGSSALWLFESGLNPVVGWSSGIVDYNDHLSLTYDGQFVRYYCNLVLIREAPAPPGLRFYLHGAIYGVGDVVKDLAIRPFSNNAANLAVRLSSIGTNDVRIVGSSIYAQASGYGSCVRGEAIFGPSFVEMDIAPGGWNIIALSSNPSGYVEANQYVTFEVYSSNGAWAVYFGSSLFAGATIGAAQTGKIRITYDGVNFRCFINGTQCGPGVPVSANLTLYPKWWAYLNGITFTGLNAGPYALAQRAGELWNSAGTAQYGPSEILTIDGISAGYLSQTAWGTLTRNVNAISRIDDAGRITDGQALPLNGMSKSSTLNPAYPLSPGATPSSQIDVAASIVTFAGGSTLSLPSSTLSGLSASTYYSIFRDLVASAYVAVSGSTTAYFTSAQRYLYIGTQTTEEIGGGYETPPPPPPGYGGGFGDRPLYVEP